MAVSVLLVVAGVDTPSGFDTGASLPTEARELIIALAVPVRISVAAISELAVAMEFIFTIAAAATKN